MPGLLRVGRYWRTLKHLRRRQLVYLVLRRILHWPRRVSAPRQVARNERFSAPPAVPPVAPPLLARNTFRFLNHTRDFGAAIDWSAAGESRLWRYNLHYFDWLRQADIEPQVASAHMQSWLRDNPPFAGVGWEPYPCSLRIVNWILWLGAEEPPADVLASLALQAQWLSRHVEFHLGANHLFVNIKALLFAGVYFSGDLGKRLRTRASGLLEQEIVEQFAEDGSHYERSLMYHALLTQDLLELLGLIGRNDGFAPALVEKVSGYAERALDFAEATALPGDIVAHFNDSVGGIAALPATLRAYADDLINGTSGLRPGQRHARHFADCGYCVVRAGEDMLLFDGGAIGPDYQPGHAHCDTLSFELCLDGERLVMNCGNHDYESGPERAFARSTAAHNTVVVDGIEQSEIWGAFRVGRRARPVALTLAGDRTTTVIEAAHDGYAHLSGQPLHRRRLVIDAAFNVEIDDEICGVGERRIAAWLHFPPAAVLEYNDGGFHLEMAGQARLQIEVAGCVAAQIRTTPRYPAFGLASSGPSLEITLAGELPLRMKTRLLRADSADND